MSLMPTTALKISQHARDRWRERVGRPDAELEPTLRLADRPPSRSPLCVMFWDYLAYGRYVPRAAITNHGAFFCMAGGDALFLMTSHASGVLEVVTVASEREARELYRERHPERAGAS